MGWYRSRPNQRGNVIALYSSLCMFLCAFAQLSTLGSLRQVGEKLSKGRDLEIIMSRERLTEGIRLYVSAKLLARVGFPKYTGSRSHAFFFN